jgi:hypothetical protein
MKIE